MGIYKSPVSEPVFNVGLNKIVVKQYYSYSRYAMCVIMSMGRG